MLLSQTVTFMAIVSSFPSLDDSVVLKVITIYNKDTDTVEEVLLEELQVFKVLHFNIKP